MINAAYMHITNIYSGSLLKGASFEERENEKKNERIIKDKSLSQKKQQKQKKKMMMV